MKAMNPPESPPNGGQNMNLSSSSHGVPKDVDLKEGQIQGSNSGGVKLRKNVGTSFYTFRSRDPPQQRTRGSFLTQSAVSRDLTKRQYSELPKIETGDVLYSGYARSDTTSKLELFIVCRLGKLLIFTISLLL